MITPGPLGSFPSLSGLCRSWSLQALFYVLSISPRSHGTMMLKKGTYSSLSELSLLLELAPGGWAYVGTCVVDMLVWLVLEFRGLVRGQLEAEKLVMVLKSSA